MSLEDTLKDKVGHFHFGQFFRKESKEQQPGARRASSSTRPGHSFPWPQLGHLGAFFRLPADPGARVLKS